LCTSQADGEVLRDSGGDGSARNPGEHHHLQHPAGRLRQVWRDVAGGGDFREDEALRGGARSDHLLHADQGLLRLRGVRLRLQALRRAEGGREVGPRRDCVQLPAGWLRTATEAPEGHG
ncbi:unnamed protein product, partial [Effrenium voratum]